MNEPEEPEAVEPEDPDECPGKEDSLTLERPLSEFADDINDPKLLPDEPDKPTEESHAVNDDVVEPFTEIVVFGAGVVAFGAVVFDEFVVFDADEFVVFDAVAFPTAMATRISMQEPSFAMAFKKNRAGACLR